MKSSLIFVLNIFGAVCLLSLMPQHLLLNINENIFKALCVITVDVIGGWMIVYYSRKLFFKTAKDEATKMHS